jgi:DNA-binding transcriptional LysR family regulator
MVHPVSDDSALGPAVPFTLRQLECLVATAEAGSITGAAARLHSSDSAVSDSLSTMERTLGAPLFHRRRSKGVNPTSDGLAILPLARRILAMAEELASAVGAGPQTIAGPVRIGALGTLAPVVLPRLIVAAAERYPAVRIDVVTGDLPELITALDAAELDAVLTFDIDVPPEYERRALASTRACIVVSDEHPLAACSSASLDEVADEPMVMLDISASRAHTLELMSSHGIVPRVARRVQDYELCRALVGRGLGYSLLMRRAIDTRTWDGARVRYVAIDPPPRSVDILLVWPRGAVPARLSAISDIAAEISAELSFEL